jgi:hypothetical protein
MSSFPQFAPSLCLHGISSLKNVRRYPPLGKVLLQPRHLGETAGVEDSSPHALLLVVGVDALLARVGAVSEGRHNEALGLMVRDLVRELRRLLCCSEQLLGLLALDVAYSREVEVPYCRAAPDDPVPVVLCDVSILRAMVSCLPTLCLVQQVAYDAPALLLALKCACQN